MDEMKGFKVVRRDSDCDALVSAVMHSNYKLRTIYPPGKPAHNESGPLMFFSRLEDAGIFVYDHLSYPRRSVEIWSCTATNARPADLVLMTGVLQADVVRRWWTNQLNASDRATLVESPPGTMVADTITLLKKVEDFIHSPIQAYP